VADGESWKGSDVQRGLERAGKASGARGGESPSHGGIGDRGLEPSIFESRGTSGQRRRRGELHVCPECDSDLVYPTDWAPASDRHWHVALRCPECEWNGGGRYSQVMVDGLDEALDRGTEAVLEDLNILVRANMEDQIERFVAALDGDQILPEDF
jgi:hypothetical protein